jgi:hypothetical protein
MLIDLATAPYKEHDRAAKHPDKLEELKAIFHKWSDEVDADRRKLGVEPQKTK